MDEGDWKMKFPNFIEREIEEICFFKWNPKTSVAPEKVLLALKWKKATFFLFIWQMASKWILKTSLS